MIPGRERKQPKGGTQGMRESVIEGARTTGSAEGGSYGGRVAAATLHRRRRLHLLSAPSGTGHCLLIRFVPGLGLCSLDLHLRCLQSTGTMTTADSTNSVQRMLDQQKRIAEMMDGDEGFS